MLIMPDTGTMDFSTVLPWCFALIGACVGSFLNVVIYRIPRGMSVCSPRRSFCPTCGKLIPWYLNIPIFSWLYLRGKSACCGKPVSSRYVLVEFACAVLFGFTAWELNFEPIPVQALVCLWMACMLSMLVMDAQEMIVYPPLVVIGAFFGFGCAIGAPELVEPTALSPLQGVIFSFVGMVTGFLLFRFIALAGRLAFGRQRARFDSPQPWQLRQEGEDIVMTIGERRISWAHLFTGKSCSVTLQGTVTAPCSLAGDVSPLRFTEDALILPDGVRRSLEDFDSLSGVCEAYSTEREAMGSGDAWIAVVIGALCGWQGVLFSLVGGSFISLFFALILRVRRGVPMPFGPALILAAWIWFFWGQQLLVSYLDFLGV